MTTIFSSNHGHRINRCIHTLHRRHTLCDQVMYLKDFDCLMAKLVTCFMTFYLGPSFATNTILVLMMEALGNMKIGSVNNSGNSSGRGWEVGNPNRAWIV